jgi:hypothetical protein
MKKLILATALALSAFGAAQAASITGLANTGSATAGSEDSNYSISVVEGSTTLSNSNAYVSQDDVWPIGTWLANSADSKWITPGADQGQTYDQWSSGVYDYQLTFDLTGYDATTASFTARLAADNAVTVILNGVEIATSTSMSSWTEFLASSGFVSGINTLDFLVTNWQQDSYNPTGLRVEFTSSSVSAVPEADTYAMMLAGLGLVGFIARRRKA